MAHHKADALARLLWQHENDRKHERHLSERVSELSRRVEVLTRELEQARGGLSKAAEADRSAGGSRVKRRW
jgi:hypothetical protein